MENLINKIDVSNLIGKVLKSTNGSNYTIVAARNHADSNIQFLVAKLSDDKNSKKLLSAINKNMDKVLNKLTTADDGCFINSKYGDLEMFHIIVVNPLMRELYLDFYGLKFSDRNQTCPDFAHSYFNSRTITNFKDLKFNTIQTIFINFFSKEIGEDYKKQFINYYGDKIERNIANRNEEIIEEKKNLNKDAKALKEIRENFNTKKIEIFNM